MSFVPPKVSAYRTNATPSPEEATAADLERARREVVRQLRWIIREGRRIKQDCGEGPPAPEVYGDRIYAGSVADRAEAAIAALALEGECVRDAGSGAERLPTILLVGGRRRETDEQHAARYLP